MRSETFESTSAIGKHEDLLYFVAHAGLLEDVPW